MSTSCTRVSAGTSAIGCQAAMSVDPPTSWHSSPPITVAG